MFNKTHIDNNILMTFLKSTGIQAYPCGRRRSALIEHDLNNDSKISEDEKYRFPFDPEARLNTEANNRKHSGLNGYTQTYLISDWKSDSDTATELTLALNGYLFTIALNNSTTADDFGDSLYYKLATNASTIESNSTDSEEYELAAATAVRDATKLYANILLEDVKLLSTGFKDYSTRILRNQSQLYSSNNTPSEALDLLIADTDATNADNYYFSGLSFSAVPLTSIKDADAIGKTRSSELNTVTYKIDENTTYNVNQTLVSLCILNKTADDKWVVNEEARLPKIEHGDTTDSIVITGDATLKSNLYVEDNLNVGNPVSPAIDNNGGNIVAKYNITAEQDLSAGRNLLVDGEATINNKATVEGEAELKKNLVVGVNDQSATGTIEAKTLIKTPELTVVTDDQTGQITTDNITINKALGAPEVTVDTLLTVEGHTDVVTLTAADTVTVFAKNEDGTQKLDQSGNPIKVTIEDGAITAKNIKDKAGNEITNIDASKAKFNNVHIQELTVAGTSLDGSSHGLYAFNMQHIIKKDADMNNNYNRPVPYIDVAEQSDGTWQLQISRVTKLQKS